MARLGTGGIGAWRTMTRHTQLAVKPRDLFWKPPKKLAAFEEREPEVPERNGKNGLRSCRYPSRGQDYTARRGLDRDMERPPRSGRLLPFCKSVIISGDGPNDGPTFGSLPIRSTLARLQEDAPRKTRPLQLPGLGAALSSIISAWGRCCVAWLAAIARQVWQSLWRSRSPDPLDHHGAYIQPDGENR